MILVRKRRPCWPAAVFLVLAANFASAQNDGTFLFSSDPDSLKNEKNILEARPNAPEARYLFVTNPKGEQAEYTVQLCDAKGRVVLASGKILLEAKGDPAGKHIGRVKLEKTPPPPPPKLVIPPAPPAAPPVPPAPEPPPGIELKGRDATGKFSFVLRLINAKGDKVNELTVPVELRYPSTYVDASSTMTRQKDASEIEVTVHSKETFSGPPAVVELVFPPQASLRPNSLHRGTYRRLITDANRTVVLHAQDLPIAEDAKTKEVYFSISVDGFARAFLYKADFSRPSNKDPLTPLQEPAVRILPLGSEEPRETLTAKPAEKYPLHLEVDNARSGWKLLVQLDRSGTGKFEDPDETAVLPSAREERVFVDPGAENDSFVVNYLVNDWIYNLDTRATRGTHKLQAELVDDKGMEVTASKKFCYLVLDDLPPGFVGFILPVKHVKGFPLPIKAIARKQDVSIKQAVFFLGAPAPDGKLPDVAVEGKPVDPDKLEWAAEVPIPDKKGFIEVGVQFVNEAGVVIVKTQKIELIDPPAAAGGTIEGTVELGGRGQPKIPVSLRDGDGKEKALKVTDDKGYFKMENVAPGTYRLFAAKPDSGVGTRGDAATQVIVGKTVKVTISLARKP